MERILFIVLIAFTISTAFGAKFICTQKKANGILQHTDIDAATKADAEKSCINGTITEK